jgi:CRISPR-associated protein Cmr4
MYHKGYGIIETLAPLHVGASAGEETGNLNLIFRDQFTQTGIIPGSSIRGRFRADMRQSEDRKRVDWWYGKDTRQSEPGSEDKTSEGIVKFEYASLLWLPVFCPGQPIVRVSCPRLLKRYQKIAGLPEHNFVPLSFYGDKDRPKLFFNLGFLTLNKPDSKLKDYMPQEVSDANNYLLVVVDDTQISMIHDMALYRQSRVALAENQKTVDGKAFFNVEALPEGSVLVFPTALRKTFQGQAISWKDYAQDTDLETPREVYFGGLESVGFGRSRVILKPHPTSQGAA